MMVRTILMPLPVEPELGAMLPRKSMSIGTNIGHCA
jgi:hypothetical protein